jgi:hypothetical protein
MMPKRLVMARPLFTSALHRRCHVESSNVPSQKSELGDAAEGSRRGRRTQWPKLNKPVNAVIFRGERHAPLTSGACEDGDAGEEDLFVAVSRAPRKDVAREVTGPNARKWKDVTHEERSQRIGGVVEAADDAETENSHGTDAVRVDRERSTTGKLVSLIRRL